MNATEHHPSEEALRRALVALKDLKARVERYERAASEPIAIIGAGCRFPGGANSPEAYWELLRAGRDGIGPVPASRWDHDRYFDPDPDRPATIYTDRGGFLDEPVDQFDATFFGIAPVEARAVDPQQRLLLEVTWEALEHAGIAPDSLAGSSTGVFIGLGTADYSNLQMRAGDPTSIGRYYGTGSALSVAAGRIAYVLGLRGPTLALDTACSSSLVAIALAMQGLRSDTCRMAVVGGVNLMLDPLPLVFLSQFRALSPTGRCHTFGAGADGYLRAEGCGVVVLKRLADAEADGDRVLAVLRGAATNHDGRSSGLTVPSGTAQREVLEHALADARLTPADIDLVEAHGTGTQLGDPIEVRAIDAVYSKGHSAANPLLITSVKTNIGHLEAAAGLAGLLKVVLAIQHGEVPPHLLDGELSPHIDWSSMPVKVARELQPWPATDGPRRAAVSAFGLSGTNAHLIVEEAPPRPPRADADARPVVLTLAARDEAALGELAQQTAKLLPRHDRIADAAWTAQVGRALLPHRLAITASSVADAATQLHGWSPDTRLTGVSHRAGVAGPPPLAFLFTGQGAQRPGMGRDLYEHEPAFRAVMDDCDRLLRPHLTVPLLDVMFGDDPRVAALVHQTEYTQPAMFALQCGLAALWRTWGVTPTAVAGHSIGEYAAAVVAGVMDLDAAAELIAVRGQLMGALPEGGAMVAIFADEDRVRRLIEPHRHHVSVAASNGPTNVVISGDAAAVASVVAGLDAGVSHRALQVSRAFHSPLMVPMVEAFGAHADTTTYRTPTVAFMSSVTGGPATAALATPTYWRDHVLVTVRFGAAVEALRQAGIGHFLEIGPQPTLLGLVARIAGDDSGLHASLRPRDGRDERAQLADAVGSLWTAGVEIDWRAIDQGRSQKVDLPTYPFQRQRFWLAETASPVAAAPAPAAAAIDDDVYEPQWVPLPAAVPAASGPGRWLVIGGATSDATAAELRRRGLAVELVAEVTDAAAAGTWAGVVLAAPATADAGDPVAGQRHRLQPLLGLVQRLQAHDISLVDGGRLWVLTTNGQSVAGQADPVDLTEAPVWGMANAVTVEEPNLRIACVDIDPRRDGDVTLVVDELLDGGPEDRIALRGGARHGLRLARLRQEPTDGLGGASLDGDGAYLVTGGLGALGLNAARSLASRGARHLALLARRSPSDAALAAIAELRDAGVDVAVFAGDVADAERVEAVTAEIRSTMGPLRGVIHAAGVLDDGTLRNLDWARFESVLRPKVAGAWNLHGATLADPLDFFVLYSSAASLLGSSGQANYVAANAFLDALAHHRQASGRPGLSIDWGGWDEAGMAARLDDGQRSRLAQTGVGLIDPATGDRLLGRLLTTTAAQVGVVPVDWSEVARLSPAAMHRPFYQALVGPPTAAMGGAAVGSLVAELAALDPDERYDHVRQHVRAAIVTVLGLEDVSALEAGLGLAELGMDSLMAVDLCNRLQWTTAVPLESTLAFEWPSLEALSRHLAHDRLGIPTAVMATNGHDERAAAAEREAAERRAEIESISELEAETSLLAALERSGY
jgi:acyl transferase domain-containing protein